MLSPTTPLFVCPQCQAPVRASDVNCRACGVNLALAAVITERQVMAEMPPVVRVPMGRATDLPRFGEFLVKHDFISPEQLQTALARQREGNAQGEYRTLGQTLLDMGAVARETLERASIEQMKELQHALEESKRELEERVVARTAELEKALSRLTELDDLKASFVASLSHELRTPLVPIKGYADLLLNGTLGELNPMQTESIRAIGRSVARLEELVVELLQFSASVKGRLVIAPTILSMHDMTSKLSDYFGPKAEAKQIALDLELPMTTPVVQADAEKIYWVMFQLLDNALKFNKPGGAAQLRTETRPTTLRISVRDTGIGIAPERVGLIFQPFNTTREVNGEPLYDGTGIGLALAKRIVEAHNSKIEVESALGVGSAFSFELPLLKQP
jgi:signal transduction histidine kinase